MPAASLPARCPTCGLQTPGYVGLTECESCLKLRILPPSEAKDWVVAERARLTAQVSAHLGDRSMKTVLPIMAQLEGAVLTARGAGFNVDFAALGALDALCAVLEEPVTSKPVAPNRNTALVASLALYDLGMLEALPHQVEQGEVDIVEGLPANKHPHRTTLQPHFPLVRAGQIWTRWTQVAYNRGPDLHTEPAFFKALSEDDPEASTPALAGRGLRLAGHPNIEVLPIVNAIDRQMFKAHAPRIAATLASMPDKELGRIQSFLDAFTYYADDTIGEHARDILTVSRRELTLRVGNYSDASTLANLTINSQTSKVIPIAVKGKLDISFPAQLSRHLRRLVLNYRGSLHGDRAMSDLASDCFERVVSRTLRGCGYHTVYDGKELVSIATRKGGANEVDVFVWNDSEVLLIEAKFEIDPPGAWAGGMVTKRSGPEGLGKHVKQHSPKQAAWDAHLRTPNPTARFHPRDELVRLPPALLKTRSIRLLIVSGRVEPYISYPIEIVTFMPPKAAALAVRKLPAGRFCRIWDGTTPP